MNHKLSILMIFCAVLFMSNSPALCQSSAKCTVKIIVRDKKSGTPISDAVIQESTKPVGKTDGSGVAFLTNREAGYATYTVIRNGYLPRSTSFTVAPDTTEGKPVLMDSEKTIKDEIATELKKKNPDNEKVKDLAGKLFESYDLNKNDLGKQELLKVVGEEKRERRNWQQ
jgi:hypothetical protein